MPANVVEIQKEKLTTLKRLWLHEVMRVFSDRLIDNDDKQLFINECLNFEGSSFFKAEDLKSASTLIFCNFVNPDPDNPVYMQATSNEALRAGLIKIIELFNA